MTALASGSSGNAFLIQAGETSVLLDAGISLAALRSALAGAGLAFADLACLLLTHEHSDHLSAAAALSRRHGLPLVGTEGTLACLGEGAGERACAVPGSAFRVGELAVTAFSVPHDGADPVGYLLEHDGSRVCLATDLGQVPEEVLPVLRSCQLLIVEANHDRERLWRGPYPRSLKQRVAGGSGHLSNDQAGECLANCASGGPQWVWLAHLSATNNSPRCALRTVTARLLQEAITTMQVQVALRDKPSLSWSSSEAYCQPRLF